MLSRRHPLANQKAIVGWLANDETSTRPIGAPSTLSNVGQDVIERVRKCFARADHPNSNENEARAAVKMASKIMDQYNISQADLMEQEDQTRRAARGGSSTVNILAAKEDGVARTQLWVQDLVCAVRKFFDCNAYSTLLPDMIEWTFFGIVEHTVSAAIAFEMIHNLILEWAGSFDTVATRNSYSLGVADGLCQLAEEEKVATENAAREAEAKALAARLHEEDIQQEKELDRLRNPPLTLSPPPTLEQSQEVMEKATYERDVDCTDAGDSSDNEAMADFNDEQSGTMVDTTADFDTELQKFIIRDSDSESDARESRPPSAATLGGKSTSPRQPEDMVPTNPKPETTELGGSETKETVEWRSMRQLTVFRENLKEVEESVLKDQGVKLTKGKKRKRSVKDREVFRQGRQDASKINVKAARIEEGET